MKDICGVCTAVELMKYVWIVLVMKKGISAQNIEKRFFNLPAHCGHTDEKQLWNNVQDVAAFNVLVDPSLDTNALTNNCQMVFGSSEIDDRLCVYQRSLKFDTNHAQLELYDGYINDTSKQEANETINHDQILRFVEWCTTQRFLTIRMVKSGTTLSMNDIHIDLLVYDIRSHYRKASMDTSPSCSSTFILNESRVNVSNIDPAMVVNTTFAKCRICFEYVGQEEHRRVCLVFESRDPTCSRANYTLTINQTIPKPDTGIRESIVAGTRSCKQPEPMRWCSNSTKLTLELERHGGMSTTEKDVVFSVLVMDHSGNVTTLEDTMRTRTLPTRWKDPHSAGASHSSVVIVHPLVTIVHPLVLAILCVHGVALCVF